MPAKYYKGIGKLQGGYIFFAMARRYVLYYMLIIRICHLFQGKQYYLDHVMSESKIKRGLRSNIRKLRNNTMLIFFPCIVLYNNMCYHNMFSLFFQGKRSASDHIHEATNYINYLQNNIQELEIKRDTLKKLLKEQNFKTGSCSKTLPIIVTVKSCRVGIEVSITGDFTIPLSSVLQILVEEGLNVISSICTKVEGRSHYAIQSEVKL